MGFRSFQESIPATVWCPAQRGLVRTIVSARILHKARPQIRESGLLKIKCVFVGCRRHTRTTTKTNKKREKNSGKFTSCLFPPSSFFFLFSRNRSSSIGASLELFTYIFHVVPLDEPRLFHILPVHISIPSVGCRKRKKKRLSSVNAGYDSHTLKLLSA